MPNATRITEFEILRGVIPGPRSRVKLERKPLMVATLLDGEAFEAERLLVHGRTLFLHDQMHDYAWSDGELRYYPHQGGAEDVLVIFATEEVKVAPRFDHMTGKALGN